ncbi:MAG: SH3 domain-containing protein [Anaerolineae bacterium]|nr:SH3 domain-containing protein [Anaerolineae bacterium]
MRKFLILLLMSLWLNTAAAQDSCAMPPRLTVGEGGRVLFTDGSPLNVRSAAGRASSLVGELAEGTSFMVLEGAVCADGIQWWHIESGDLSGWGAEGVDDTYFIEPISAEQVTADQTLKGQLASLDVENLFTRYTHMMTADGLRIFSPDGDVRDISLLPAPENWQFIDAAVAPDGSQVVWLYRCTDCVSGMNGKRFFAAQIIPRDALLMLTDLDGTNPRELWRGSPIGDTTNLLLEGWRADSGAVFLHHTSTFAYPEPGSDPNADLGYPPPESGFIEIGLDGTETIRISNTSTIGAISPDGQWVAYDDGERFSRVIEANHLQIESLDGLTYTVPFAASNTVTQMHFSPDSAWLVWADVSYVDYVADVIKIKMLSLSDGSTTTLRTFPKIERNYPEGYPIVLGWLSDHWMLVALSGNRLVVDLTTGGWASVDLPDGTHIPGEIRP